MPKIKIYKLEFKKKIVNLYLEERPTIKNLNKEYLLGNRTFRKIKRYKEIAFLKKATTFFTREKSIRTVSY